MSKTFKDYLNGKILVQPDTGIISSQFGDSKTENVLIIDIIGGNELNQHLLYHGDSERTIQIDWRNYIKTEGYRGRESPFFDNWDI